MDRVKQLSKKATIVSLNAFVEGAFFPVTLGAVVFLFYALNLPIVTLAILALCACYISLFAKNTRTLFSILLFAMIALRYKDNAGAYTTVGAIVAYCILGPILLSCLIYRLVAYRVKAKRQGLCSMGLLCLAFLLSGIFTKYCTLANAMKVIGCTGALFVTYFFFLFTMEKQEDDILYLARICAVAVCMISLEVGECYLRHYQIGMPLDWIWKEKIILGWSISNMVGEMIVFMLPAVFYLIYKEEKGYWYWIVIVVATIGIYFTLSRNALLWCAVVLLSCSLVNCFKGKHVKINRIVVIGAISLFAVVMIILLFAGYLDGLLTFFLETGFNDRGRSRVWREHFQLFKEHPLQGVGFKAYHEVMQVREHTAHNNLLQMLTSTGIIGLTLYLVHRAQTIYMILKKRTAERMFMGGCIGIALLISFLSPLFFGCYFMVYYSVVLLVLEKSLEE